MAREASAEGVSSREKDEVSEKERARRFTCLLCFRGARHLSLLRPPNPPSHNAGPLARTSDRRPATAQHQALAGVGRAGGADAGGEGYVGGGKKRRACVTGRGGGLLRQCSSNAPSARALAHSPAPAQPSSLRPTATRAAPRSHWRTYGEKTERERARRDVRAEKKTVGSREPSLLSPSQPPLLHPQARHGAVERVRRGSAPLPGRRWRGKAEGRGARAAAPFFVFSVLRAGQFFVPTPGRPFARVASHSLCSIPRACPSRSLRRMSRT